ncbi:putative MFS monosaccharide transporter [Aspergillus candidus]|uniref:Putative MFS monosaccharide transporter n=1 Tax=Aspergillus candidus TaxID=41067 RepID=A0A2I2FNK7_ASPCN|nr:putative MFS monosaccharide transporter [Aspergillus candidus]PLB42219.1 putative MFS monosaccharide transporter [Aspergillus candidus]
MRACGPVGVFYSTFIFLLVPGLNCRIILLLVLGYTSQCVYLRLPFNMPPTFAGMSGRPLSLSISTVATMGFLLFGYDQGVMSGIISDPSFNNMFIATKGDNVMQATVTAVYEVGCLFGAIFALIFGELLGRRWMIISGAAVMIVGVVIQVTAISGSLPLLQFIFGRVITGIGNGMNTSTIPTYQAECSKTSNRGLLICIEGGVIAIGTMIAYWIDYGAHFGPPDLAWRFPIAFQVVFGIFIIVGMCYLPESPRYLIAHDRVDEGEKVLAALKNVEVDDSETQLEKNLVLDSIRASGAEKAKFRDLLTGGPSQHFRRMVVGSSAQVFQQISGCNAVIYYLPVLLEQSIGQSHNFALLIGGINMICYAIFATFSWFFVEKIGRRKLFLGGSYGQCASMIIVFACLIPGDSQTAKGAVFGLFLYMCFFGATWLPLPWLYPAELSPIKTRSKANAISTCNNWLFNFTVVMITPVMIAHIGWGTYLFFAAWNAVFIPVIWFFYPETAGRSLEEIDLIFAKGYMHQMSYVRAAKELPRLQPDEIEEQARELGVLDENEKIEERIARDHPSDSAEFGSFLPTQL